jgi:hypothetical protein
MTHGFPNPDMQLTVSMGVLKARYPANYQCMGSQIQTPLTVSVWVLKSRHPTDCQHMESQSRTVHGQSEFGKPWRFYLSSLGAWGFLGCPWDPRMRESDLQMQTVAILC